MDRLKLSQWWPWRWMFWRRVRCHMRGCRRVATVKCVYHMGDMVLGANTARDPLCGVHGQPGPCPDARLDSPSTQTHELIPPEQCYYRVRFRVHIGWEDASL